MGTTNKGKGIVKYCKLFLVGLFCLSLLLLPSCQFFSGGEEGLSRSEEYLEIRSTPDLVIPEHMDAIEIEDLWTIPEIVERPLPLVFPKGAPRPATIVGDADPDLVRIQSLGNRSWMVVQRSPETVWPVVKQWLQDNGITTIAIENAGEGLLVTNALQLDPSDIDNLGQVVQNSKSNTGIVGGVDQIALRIENGIRLASTEVHVRYLNSSSAVDSDAFEWPETSTDIPTERKVLEHLANYDASGYVAPTHSRIAEQIALRPKAEMLIDDDGYPYLQLNVDFARAWATVQKALDNASLEVTEQDSSQQFFQVEVSKKVLRGRQRSFIINRLTSIGQGDTGSRPDVINVILDKRDEGYSVEVSSLEAGDSLSVEFVQQILLILREYAV